MEQEQMVNTESKEQNGRFKPTNINNQYKVNELNAQVERQNLS